MESEVWMKGVGVGVWEGECWWVGQGGFGVGWGWVVRSGGGVGVGGEEWWWGGVVGVGVGV